jgi:hypothetical protein
MQTPKLKDYYVILPIYKHPLPADYQLAHIFCCGNCNASTPNRSDKVVVFEKLIEIFNG